MDIAPITPLVGATSGLALGALHALAPDHCAGLAACTTADMRLGAMLRTSLRFALGHGLILIIGSIACLLTGLWIPSHIVHKAEIAAGIGLCVLGIILWQERSHRWLQSRHASVWVGGALAFSGIRGMLMAFTPLLLVGNKPLVVAAYVAGFVGGMSIALLGVGGLMGLGFKVAAASHAAKKSSTLPSTKVWARRTVASLSIVTGGFWILQQWVL